MIRMDTDGLLEEVYAQQPGLAKHMRNLCGQMRACAREADETGGVPEHFWSAVDARELNAAHLPQEYGGSRAVNTVLRRTLIAEQLGRADPGLALGLPGPGLSRTPILALGTVAQRARLFARFQTDTPMWGAFATSEPAAGSDATSMRTRAADGGDCWVLNGDKCFIGSGARAAYAVVFATIDPSRGRFGLRAFIVDRGTPGFTATPMPGMLGMRAAQVAQLALRDCRIPKENMLGFDGKVPAADAFSGAQRSWDFMRPLLSAVIVGACAGMIEQAGTLLESQTRRTPLARAECARVLADLHRRYLCTRLLVHQAAWRHDRGLAMSKEASMAKAHAAAVAMHVAEGVTRLAGIAALADDALLEKWYRDAKAFDILEGTGDMQRLMIAKIHSTPRRGSLTHALAAARGNRCAPRTAGSARR